MEFVLKVNGFCNNNAKVRQLGVNELRLQQASSFDTRTAAVEADLKKAIKRTESVADLYADVFARMEYEKATGLHSPRPDPSDVIAGEAESSPLDPQNRSSPPFHAAGDATALSPRSRAALERRDRSLDRTMSFDELNHILAQKQVLQITI